MKKILQDAKDKYVTSVIVFGDSTNHTLHVDEELTTQVSAEVVLDAFLKGVLVVAVGTNFVRPAQVADDGATVDVNGTNYAADNT